MAAKQAASHPFVGLLRYWQCIRELHQLQQAVDIRGKGHPAWRASVPAAVFVER
jgi:hypothetical protein